MVSQLPIVKLAGLTFPYKQCLRHPTVSFYTHLVRRHYIFNTRHHIIKSTCILFEYIYLLKSNSEEVKTAVRIALDAGYRLFDTAFNYQNEDAIGEVLNDYLKANKIKREDLFISTKLGSVLTRPTDVQYSISESLRKLHLSYVDLFLIHFPVVLKKQNDPSNILPMIDGQFDNNGVVDFEGVWKEMEKLFDKGKARSIGVSNFNAAQVERIMNIARVKPVVNQGTR
ncbi:aldo-keto reductase family 1 member C13-like [Pecten maximus]|uniref:aldo-keto reductase family 1 member C13-like n=1 Tax=Pecten maximus TaxID=6579 RepID=UPI0014585659|nr:aldo-keto reductase family 1 member C13-like [Pecten maximus]